MTARTLLPELPAYAALDELGDDEAAELAGTHHDAALCSNRTCEIGLQQSTGDAFTSFVFLLEAATRPA